MKRIKELVPGALDNFNAYYDTRYKNSDLVSEYNVIGTNDLELINLDSALECFNDYLAPCTVIELVEVTDDQRD